MEMQKNISEKQVNELSDDRKWIDNFKFQVICQAEKPE